MSRETEGESPEKIPEVTPTKPQPKKGLEALLEEKGLDASDLIGLIEALGSLKKRDQSHANLGMRLSLLRLSLFEIAIYESLNFRK